MSTHSGEPPKAERTVFAIRALDFSTFFNAKFQKMPIGGDMTRIPTVVEPERMSTGQGAAARQPIVLVPQNQQGSSVTVGWVDTAKNKGHLKTFEYLEGRHEARKGDFKFGVAESGYNTFFREAMKFMHEHEIACSTDQVYGGTRPTITRKSGLRPRSNPLLMAAAAVGAVMLAGALFYFFINR